MRIPTLATTASTLSALLALMVIGIWACSYFVVDEIGHIYAKYPGHEGHYSMVEGQQWWIAPSTLVTEVDTLGGLIVVDHPCIDGAPIGWRHLTENYRGVMSHQQSSAPVNWFGYCSHDGVIIAPIWPLACGLSVLPAMFFWQKFRRRSGRGFLIAL